MVIVVPWPSLVTRSIVPFKSSIFDLTISVPIPRPETSVTFSAVLSPGSQINWAI